MLVLCGGSVLVGAAASLALPFLPFAAALAFAIGAGAVWAGLHGAGAGPVAGTAAVLLVTAQLGYGAGLIAAAFGAARQDARRAADQGRLPDLNLGEKP